jgi:hypothetical protein
MAIEIETKILEGLNSRLASLTLSPALNTQTEVSWPKLPFNSAGKPRFLRPTLLPARTEHASLGLDGINRYSGIYQVDVFYAEGTRPPITPNETAGAIARHFKRGTVITREGIEIIIDTPPSLGPDLEEPGWSRLAVSIPYRVDAPNPA